MIRILILLMLVAPYVGAQSRYDSLWADSQIESRIQQGIEKNRKGDARVKLVVKKGKIPKGSKIEVRQLTHDFQFGSNIFMLNGYATASQNQRYEEVFKSLFNLACVPFYWKTLEPQEGVLRYTDEASQIYRRPPPDPVLDFCEKNKITPKGHTLVWDNVAHSTPDWMSKDISIMDQKIATRISQLGQRYSSRVKTWDVVNELLSYNATVIRMPDNYGLKAFQYFSKSFTPDTRGFINETTNIWTNYRREYSPYKLLIDHLKADGAKIDGIGLQFHFFSETLHQEVVAGKTITPQTVFDVLDLYGSYRLPIHISEITIPALPFNETGLLNQAKLTRNFYRAWFSHDSVEAIVWWNVSDGTAVAGEDKWHGGFLNEDLSPKPAYHALNNLINKEWKTNLNQDVEGDTVAFRGFYGNYTVKVTAGKKVVEQQFSIKKDSKNELVIEL